MDFSTVPLFALSIETKKFISTLLNPPKILPTDNGLPRDWRGLPHVFEMPGETILLLASHSDPTNRILESAQEKNSKKITFNDFVKALEMLERWDVIDDVQNLLEKDAQIYAERLERSQLFVDSIDSSIDAQMLTVDDLYRHRAGLEKQCYDAFLLYADEDFEFAKEMMDRLEKENLKICTKDRDLIAGVTFEHEAIMQLISERCNRLIVIISPNFLKSSANNFFLTYAQAVGIDKQQRKLIPCIYKDCVLPPQLSYMNKINYRRKDFYDFWGRLCDSVRTSVPEKSKRISQESSTSISVKDVEKKVNELSVETCDTKLLQVESDTSKKEENSEESEEVAELSKYSKISRNFLKSPKKKVQSSGANSEQTSEKQISDSIPSLPSVSSLDDVDLLPTNSNSEKKKKKKFVKSCIKKMQSVLKS